MNFATVILFKLQINIYGFLEIKMFIFLNFKQDKIHIYQLTKLIRD